MDHFFKTFLVFSLMFFSGCKVLTPVSEKNSQITQGKIESIVKVDHTSKAEILRVFGAPNIMTRDKNGDEVWTYQRSSYLQESSTSNSVFFLFGIFDGSSFGSQSSSSMITFIIKFDSNDIVIDYSSRSSHF